MAKAVDQAEFIGMSVGTRIKRLRVEWKRFREGKPGSRFRDRYQRRLNVYGDPTFWRHVIYFGGALVLLCIGLLLAVLPGPAVLFYALAAALLATGSRRVSTWLDRAEVWLRRQWACFQRWRAERRGDLQR